MKNLNELTPLQYHVTQENGTERPFDNIYFEHSEPGVYVDIISGEPLFSSVHKFHSPCGWPAFFKAIVDENIVKVEDNSHGMRRVEVRSKKANSHLGHVFPDGPAPTGIRYCINSAAIDFVSLDKLDEMNLGEFKLEIEDSLKQKG